MGNNSWKGRVSEVHDIQTRVNLRESAHVPLANSSDGEIKALILQINNHKSFYVAMQLFLNLLVTRMYYNESIRHSVGMTPLGKALH